MNKVEQLQEIKQQYEALKARDLSLNLSRGMPSEEQLDLSNELLSMDITPYINNKDFIDIRNYGYLRGLREAREFFAEMMDVRYEQVMVGSNSSLQMMAIVLNYLVNHAESQWKQEETIKFICPVPGYDRHFNMLEHSGFEIIPVELTGEGPDMDEVERLVKEDSAIKGIFCVPKYSNPSGDVYSDDVVRRLAQMETADEHFVILWDNAYCVHHLTDEKIEIANIIQLAEKAGYPERPIAFTSTSKITHPGAGISAVAGSEKRMNDLAAEFSYQLIGFDKVNQMRQVLFLKDQENLEQLMEKHAEILRPKFKIILEALDKHFGDGQYEVEWNEPKGGYFVHLTTKDGTAKAIVDKMTELGIVLTPANAPYPVGHQQQDNSIRLAPSYASLEAVKVTIQALIVCIKLVYLSMES